MSIKLTYRGQTTLPIEVEGLTPDWARDKSVAEIERFEIFHGNRRLPLAELFVVSGAADDERLEFEGNLAGVHWIGAHMRTGQIHVHGPAGRHLGSEMRGGEIHVHGDVGSWVGCEMRGGLIHIRGNAGDLVGAAYRGSAQGMRGGTIIVEGNAGNEVGLLIKHGTIAIGGNVGDMLGFNMVDGTILVLGNCGLRPGAGMHGGAIGLFGPRPPKLLPSFQRSGSGPPTKLFSAFAELCNNVRAGNDFQLPAEASVFIGDRLAAGNGEIYLPGNSP